jgi:Ca2+-binding EF-hand superfamily protein
VTIQILPFVLTTATKPHLKTLPGASRAGAMGSCLCSSVTFEIHPDIPGQDQLSKEVFDKLHLTQLEINSFYIIFLNINKTGTPYVYRAEITAYFKIEEGELTNRIFDLFAKKSGKLDFCQFLCTMWNFLSLEADDLSGYAFVLFDQDHSGSLSYDEIVLLIETIHRKKYSENSGVQSLCDEIRLISRFISFKQFRKFAKLHPSLCGPLASMQFMMQKTMLGDTFWTRLQMRRGRHGEQTDSRYLQKLLTSLREKYLTIQLKNKIHEMDGETQHKIHELKTTRQSRAAQRERSDQMLEYFQLNPVASKKKKRGGGMRSPIKRAGKAGSPLMRKTSRIDVMGDEESEGEEEEDDDDNIAEGEDAKGKGDDEQTHGEKVEQGPSSPQPRVISNTRLRKSLLVKQNTAPDLSSSSSDSKPKTLFHPSSVPRKSMVNGVIKILPPPSNDPTTTSSPVPAPQPEGPRPRKSIALTPAGPLPAISNTNSSSSSGGNGSRKSLIHTASLPNSLGGTPLSPQRRVTKLEPIKR